MPKISIIVPVYNAELYLHRCIESIQHQDEKDIEIILIDDASNDGSLLICEEYKKRDARIIVYTKENGGPHSARKMGVSYATAPYIAFVDSDDWIGQTLASQMITDMEHNQVDCVLGGHTVKDKKGVKQSINRIESGLYSKLDLERNIYPKMFCPYNSFEQNILPSLCGKLFKKELISEVVNKLDEDIHIGEDLACTFRYLLESNSIYINNGICEYYYDVHDESNTNRYDPDYFSKAIRSSNFLERTAIELKYIFLKENIERYRLYQIYREIGIAIKSSDDSIYQTILSDIETAVSITEYKVAFQNIDVSHLEISVIERWIFMCLKYNKKSLFCFICMALRLNAKRKK